MASIQNKKDEVFNLIKQDIFRLRSYIEAYEAEGIISAFSGDLLNGTIDNIEFNIENILD